MQNQPQETWGAFPQPQQTPTQNIWGSSSQPIQTPTQNIWGSPPSVQQVGQSIDNINLLGLSPPKNNTNLGWAKF